MANGGKELLADRLLQEKSGRPAPNRVRRDDQVEPLAGERIEEVLDDGRLTGRVGSQGRLEGDLEDVQRLRRLLAQLRPKTPRNWGTSSVCLPPIDAERVELVVADAAGPRVA
jgi:hypothetical protein